MRKNLVFTLIGVALVVTLTSFMSISTLVKGLFADKSETASAPENMAAPAKSLYDFTVKSLEGKPVALSAYKGKKVVILNVASKCGFTPQYADWEKFYKEHGDKVVVLGFPANNFGSQEPGYERRNRCILPEKLRRYVPNVRKSRRSRWQSGSALQMADDEVAERLERQSTYLEFLQVRYQRKR